MSTLTGDFWVCGECRSINNAGARQCYNCRSPRDRAAVDPAAIEGTGHGKLREIELPPFRSSRGVAALASVLILAVAAMQVILTLVSSQLDLQVLGGDQATEEQGRYIDSVRILTLGAGALALIGWSLWLSRAVTAMPALGLGYPAANGLMAFVENFLPGLNLLRVPAIVRDVVQRLDPSTSRGEVLILAAWIGLLGGFFVPRIGAVIMGISGESPEGTKRTDLAFGAIATGFVVVGAIVLVALIWWVEERIARRRVAQLAGAAASPDGPAVPAMAPGGTPEPAADQPLTEVETVPDVVETRSAFAAASSTWPTTVDAAPSEARVDVAPAPAPAFEVASEPEPEPEPVLTAEAPARLEPEPAAPAPEPEPAAPAPEPEAPARLEPEPEPEPVLTAEAPPRPEPVPAAPEPGQPERAAASESAGGLPHLTIRVTNRGMMTAEVDGETEHVILDDLAAYGSALARVGGTAAILPAGGDDMAQLIARRAKRILEDAGVHVTGA